MDDRILKLAKEAGLFSYDSDDSKMLEAEKFAELLIEDRDRLLKRSLDILLRIKHDYECKDGLGYDLMLTMAIFDTIKKLQNHLGVKP